MHEMSLVQNLIKQLKELAALHHAKKINKVSVEIGVNSGVVTDSFQFGFDVLSQETPLTLNSKLEIVELFPGWVCNKCKKTSEFNAEIKKECLFCGSDNISLCTGDEIRLRQVEME